MSRKRHRVEPITPKLRRAELGKSKKVPVDADKAEGLDCSQHPCAGLQNLGESVKLQESFGFSEVAYFREVG